MFIVRVETNSNRKFYRQFASENGMMEFIKRYVEDYEDAHATSEHAIFEDDVARGDIEFGLELVELNIENHVSFEIIKTNYPNTCVAY